MELNRIGRVISYLQQSYISITTSVAQRKNRRLAETRAEATMNISIISVFIVLIISVGAEKITVLDTRIYKSNTVFYETKNDIVDINIPVLENPNEEEVFLVERNLTDGSFKGLYALERNAALIDTYMSKKVLDNGQCIASDSNTIFFGASDGIYTYNYRIKKAEKFGNITADIKAIQKHSNHDIIYVITDNKLKKITENGTKVQDIESVNGVQEMVTDKNNNVYLYERDNAEYLEVKYKKLKVIVDDKVIDVKGLPDKYKEMKLTRTVSPAAEAILFIDKRLYRIFPNGTSEATEFVFENMPTAFCMDRGIIQVYGHDKKMYHFNLFEVLLQGIDLTNFDQLFSVPRYSLYLGTEKS